MHNQQLKDVFEDKLQLPEKVCVLAPGPNGKAQWPRIDCFTIAVNYAVHIGQPDMWIVADWWGIKTDWFPKIDKTYLGNRCFSQNLILKRPADAIPADWSFRFTDGKRCVKPLGSGKYSPHPDELRPDGTSSGLSIELAARCGAREIAVCGVDFFGKKYYNNREGCFTRIDRSGSWTPYLPFFNSLIAWVKAQGIDIYSLSETELDLEVR